MGFAEVAERNSFSTKYAKHDFNVILKRGTYDDGGSRSSR